MLYPPSGLPDTIVNEKQLERNTVTFFTKASRFLCNACAKNDTVLLPCPKSLDSLPGIFDTDPEEVDIYLSEFPDGSVGDQVQHTRDRVYKTVQLVSLLLEPIHSKILCTIKCDEHKMIQTARELVKFEGDEDVQECRRL